MITYVLQDSKDFNGSLEDGDFGVELFEDGESFEITFFTTEENRTAYINILKLIGKIK